MGGSWVADGCKIWDCIFAHVTPDKPFFTTTSCASVYQPKTTHYGSPVGQNKIPKNYRLPSLICKKIESFYIDQSYHVMLNFF